MKQEQPCVARRVYSHLAIVLLSFTTYSSSFAQETTSATVKFRSGAPQFVTVERVGNVAVAQSDIIVGHADKLFSERKQTKGLSNTVYGAIWPNGIVPYFIDSELSAAATTRIRQAIEHWSDVEVVKLIERTSSNASSFPNYIHFVNENQCASWVGFQNSGPQAIYSGDKCSTGSMIHEIGHALGLLHEHTRPDRDKFVRVNWSNIISGKEHNFEILTDGLPLGAYDYGSIMHYGERFFSTNGATTLQPINNTSATIGQRDAASEGDKASVSRLYQTNLALVIQADKEDITAGDTLPLSLYVTNQSDVGANTLQIELPVPTNTRLLSYSSGQWQCMQNKPGADVTCNSVVLMAGADSSVSIELQTASTVVETMVSASLSSLTDDADINDNSDSITYRVLAAADSPSDPSPAEEIEATPTPVTPEVSPTAPTLAESEVAPASSNNQQASAPSSPFKIAAAQSGGNAGQSDAGGGTFTSPGIAGLALFALLISARRRLRK